MMVCVNGSFVPEEEAVVSVFDRSFLYGDGLFETCMVLNGRPFRWEQHMARLEAGAKFLGLMLPWQGAEFKSLIARLVEVNELPDCLIRLTISRGVGRRGYSPRGARSPFFVVSAHPLEARAAAGPPHWNVITSSLRLPVDDPFARFKNCSKVMQVVARAEADAAGADEALLLNTGNRAVEGTSSNLFWIEAGALFTPPLQSGILPGVSRAVVQELGASLSAFVQEKSPTLENLKAAQGVFFSLTSAGLAECASLDGIPVPRSPLTRALYDRYWALVGEETGSAAARAPSPL